jgi:heme A synthase
VVVVAAVVTVVAELTVVTVVTAVSVVTVNSGNSGCLIVVTLSIALKREMRRKRAARLDL